MLPKNKEKEQLLTRKKVNVFQDKTTAHKEKIREIRKNPTKNPVLTIFFDQIVL